MDYQQYLQTTHWKKTREKVLNGANHCRICFSEKNIHIHHKLYSRPKYWGSVKRANLKVGSVLFNEDKTELIPLCSSCHAQYHSLYKKEFMDKHFIIKAKRLIKYGVMKKWAFILARQNDVYVTVWDAIQKMNAVKGA